jgi:iron complex outermembrane receptor protein
VLGGNLFWKKFAVRMNAGRNYRIPSLNDLYWSPGGNPDLLPEQNWSAEVGVNRDFWKSDWKLIPFVSMTAHANRVDNWILWVPTTFSWWAPENVSQVQVKGLELQAGLNNRSESHNRIKPQIRASYSYTSSQVRASSKPNDQSLGKQLIYTPKHAGQVMLRLRYRFWHLRYQQEFTGSRFTARDHSESVAGYTLGNIHAGRNFQKKDHTFTLQAGLNNIFNASYQNIAWRAMPGRSFFVRLQWDFNREKEL